MWPITHEEIREDMRKWVFTWKCLSEFRLKHIGTKKYRSFTTKGDLSCVKATRTEKIRSDWSWLHHPCLSRQFCLKPQEACNGHFQQTPYKVNIRGSTMDLAEAQKCHHKDKKGWKYRWGQKDKPVRNPLEHQRGSSKEADSRKDTPGRSELQLSGEPRHWGVVTL